MGLPVYRTAAFRFSSAQEYTDVLGGEAAGYSYSRVDNPTADAFAQAVAALEGIGLDREVVGQPFASGMSAISTVLMALTRSGAHVVAPREIYGGTYGLLTTVLDRFGVETSFVDGTDLDAVRSAIRPETTVLWGETIANPTLSVADLPGLAALAREAGVHSVVDSTFASPAVCRPLEHGIDVVVHSATKFLGGHSDATGGVAIGAPELMDRVRHDRIDLGGMLAPDEAFLLHRGLATLPLRVDRHSRSAAMVAAGLLGHPAVAGVAYPGLSTHRDHALAAKLFDAGRFGGVLTITPRGGLEAGMALVDALRLVSTATSLGGTHSVASHIASTTHRQFSDEALAAAGIDAGAVRVSVGLEDADDVLGDLEQALDRL
ncbi:MAG: aminotransferase class I/II-fold pyridoxal phosphate-dependent enzyme [Actinobacteria bacterium]|nr:aminotransferase class I/II-fold pyridoxal phosphate-dependent enzyme [Actinomycetota bacterium]MBW3647814.1 aminotransferase class I/II-fold pyridoxal phosphate-dependent enzyme [Actinomycetota bacterium]